MGRGHWAKITKVGRGHWAEITMGRGHMYPVGRIKIELYQAISTMLKHIHNDVDLWYSNFRCIIVYSLMSTCMKYTDSLFVRQIRTYD